MQEYASEDIVELYQESNQKKRGETQFKQKITIPHLGWAPLYRFRKDPYFLEYSPIKEQFKEESDTEQSKKK